MSWKKDLSKEQTDELLNWLNELNFKISQSYKTNKGKINPKRKKRKNTKNDPDKLNITEQFDYSNSDYDSDSDSDPNMNLNSDESHVHSYISDISVVLGTPFYGFHLGQSTFLKISLASPKYAIRLAKLLTESKIFTKFIQPYEAHVPYILQFLTDYNCYALKEMSLSNYLWRSPLILLNNIQNSYQPYFNTHIDQFNNLKLNDDLKNFINTNIHKLDNSLNILDPKKFPRISRSMLELDVISSWISNRHFLNEREITQLNLKDSSASFPSQSTQYITSTKTLLNDVDNLRKSRGLHINASQVGLFDNIKRIVQESNTNWIEQDQLNFLLKKSINLSKLAYEKKYKTDNFENFEKYIKKSNFSTAFQNIEYLQYNPKIKPCLLDTGFIDVNSSDIFTVLRNLSDLYSTSHENLDFQKADVDFNDIQNQNDDKQNPNDYSEESDNLVEDETSDVANEVTNLTMKLQEASTVGYSTVLNNSNILDSFKSSNQQLPVSLSEKIKSSILQPFQNYFKDTSYCGSELLYSFNIQQPIATSKDEFLNEMERTYSIPKIYYADPYFSKLSNYDSKPFIFAGEKFQLKCEEIDTAVYPNANQIIMFQKDTSKQYIWKYTPKLPNYTEIKEWLKEDAKSEDLPSNFFQSQIKGPTQKFKGYKYASLKTPIERIPSTNNKLSILIIEIHVNTRDKLMPDPAKDEILGIFWSSNNLNFLEIAELEKTGVFINTRYDMNLENSTFAKFDNELDIIIALVSLVEYLDPDILCGFELHNSSWGYIIERARIKYGIDLCCRFSRVVYKQNNKVGDRWGYSHASGIKITGRQMLNLWRRLRSELSLGHYTLENIVYHIFHTRIPSFTSETLTEWWINDKNRGLSYVLNYHITKIKYEMELIEKLEIVEKINEQSRLLGIDFYSMIYRGSQFKVECLLVRLAKAENFILISPSKKQVFKQDSLECIPLVMEPNSAFYKSPLIVLDFQSLYPSLIIAYNICYSTMLGRLQNYDPTKFTKMGVTNYKSPEGILKKFEQDINVTPNGMMFVRDNVRKSLLAKMLTEILNTRLYIKDTMSELKDDRELQKLYNNRQLALKLIANVTYGYTSATYSGRMPNSDIADAIVSCGRETLLKAVKEIESNERWGARVVYGDTDSLFVYLPGKTKQDAFKMGKEMENHISMLNPAPIKLKFEKVYLPSILVSKKRYIGWSFEYLSQEKPKFDAKGIETVRRDGIPAQQKILEKAITLLFGTKDISKVKSYVMEQFVKVVKNKVNVQDFMFAKEVRVGTYKNEKYIPPGARVSMKRALDDHRSTPQYKERVFYLVRKGSNKEVLRDRCVAPDEFLNTVGMELDSDYYINKVLVPPLERIFNLLGVDVRAWVREIPQTISYAGIGVSLTNVKVISCLCCGKSAKSELLCEVCKQNELRTILKLKQDIKERETKSQNCIAFCSSCSRNTLNESVKPDVGKKCCNEDCNVYFTRVKTIRETNSICEKYEKIPDW
jgi:DNA polymerase zeta